MMGNGLDRLAVIGMGWIGEYMVPCYKSLLGEGYEDRMFAVKASPGGLDGLRQKYGFEIMAGNCLERLKEHKPRFLALSVRPHEVAGVVEDTIRPYVDYRREQGMEGILMFTFAPSPRPRWYTKALGEGNRTICILPAMETVIGGLDVSSLAFNKITYDTDCPPDQKQMDEVRRFLAPLGQVFECRPDESLRLLSMSITYHMLYLLCFGLESRYEDCNGGGDPKGGCAVAARILYACNRERLGLPGLVASGPAPDRHQMEELAWLEKGWYEGALAFACEACEESGGDALGNHGGDTARNARIIAPRSFELHLLSLQLETREFLDAKLKDHTTPGGMTEEAVEGFRQLWTEVWPGLWPDRHGMGRDASAAYEISYRLARRVYKKGKALEKRR